MGLKFHFPNVTRLILCKFLLFPKFVHKFKIGIFENWLSEILNFFGNLQKGCKSRYLNVALSWIPKLSSLEIEIWYFPMLANRLHYRTFPNSLKRFRKLGLLNIGQKTSKWTRVDGSWKFLSGFLVIYEQKISVFPSACRWVYFWLFQKSKFQKFRRWNEILFYPPY